MLREIGVTLDPICYISPNIDQPLLLPREEMLPRCEWRICLLLLLGRLSLAIDFGPLTINLSMSEPARPKEHLPLDACAFQVGHMKYFRKIPYDVNTCYKTPREGVLVWHSTTCSNEQKAVVSTFGRKKCRGSPSLLAVDDVAPVCLTPRYFKSFRSSSDESGKEISPPLFQLQLVLDLFQFPGQLKMGLFGLEIASNIATEGVKAPRLREYVRILIAWIVVQMAIGLMDRWIDDLLDVDVGVVAFHWDALWYLLAVGSELGGIMMKMEDDNAFIQDLRAGLGDYEHH